MNVKRSPVIQHVDKKILMVSSSTFQSVSSKQQISFSLKERTKHFLKTGEVDWDKEI